MRHEDFLRDWFPSILIKDDPAAFYQAYNEFSSFESGGGRAIFENKPLLSAMLRSFGLRTSRLLLTIRGGRYLSHTGEEISRGEAVRLLAGKGAFLKERMGWGGIGSFKLHSDGTVLSTDGAREKGGAERLLKKIHQLDYIAEELIAQDERFSSVSPSSINTVRCVIFMNRAGSVNVAAASWRMGDGRSVVDNSSSGGIVCGIDPDSGRILGPGRDLSGGVHVSHPSSGFVFAGSEVPNVIKIFQAAKDAHRAVGTRMSIGWDIAMTPEGPLIVEGNSLWGGKGHSLVDTKFQDRAWNLFLADHKVSGSGFPATGRRIRRNEMIRATIVIKGKVQEAGFRKWFTRFAEGTGVEADAKSLEDGTIRGRLTGQRWRVEFVTLACHRGPATARIEQVDVLNVKRI